MSSYKKETEIFSSKVHELNENNLPKNWRVLPNIALFDERISKGHNDEELLSVTISKGIIRQSVGNKRDNSNEDKSSYKLVKAGDIAYNKMRMWQGAVGVSEYRGIVSPAYVVLKPKIEMNSKYYHYFFRTFFYNTYSKRFSYGLCDDQLNLRFKDFKRMKSILPPLDHQNQIANFLDQKSNSLDMYIEKKLKIKELLLKKINRILFGNRQLALPKDNLNWEDYFCEKWEFVKAKRIFKEINIKNQIHERLLAVTQDRGVIFKDDAKENFVSPTEYDNLKLVGKNDFVISLRSFQGGIEFSNIQGIVSPAYNVFHLQDGNDTEDLQIYYKYLFKTPEFITLLNTIINGIRDGKNISYKDFSNLYIPIPDKKTLEMIKILDKNYNLFKKEAKQEIELLENYLESLIYHAVTGQLSLKN
ncbi:Type I restriction modification DNA specificity domain protein [Bacillus sp. M21]|uniref:restriction endonuclease subunit S n=1 Tax=Bacillus sp. M21 TaxID=1155617 RepID=UPI000D046357|nr:restriction endonuclease subunit S [Bacillus sp. M21]PRP93751.1 Type I restriction modification DNA specificity domain protein [Bacillus sp. M21]